MTSLDHNPVHANPIAPGTVVGAYWLKTPYKHHDASFETAAWWEDTELKPGIYPLKVGVRTYGRNHPLFLYAEGIGTVVDAYFPSLLGGVAVGGSNADHHIGKPKTLRIGLDLGKAINNTGTSPSEKEACVWVDPKTWPAFLDYARARLNETISHFSPILLGKANDRPEVDQARTIKHRAEWIAEDASLLETILHRQESWNNFQDSPMMRECLHKNTEWVTHLPH
jgi:hypothetical protein